MVKQEQLRKQKVTIKCLEVWLTSDVQVFLYSNGINIIL